MNGERMLKAVLVATVIACMGTPTNAPAGLDLTWGSCSRDGGTTNVNVDCTQSHVYHLVANLQVPRRVDCAVGMTAQFDMQIEGYVETPPFWHMEQGGCNYGGLSVSASVGAIGGTCSAVSLADSAIGGMSAYGAGVRGPNRPLFFVFLTRTSGAWLLQPGINYYVFDLRVATTASDKAGGTCPGCQAKVAIVWNTADVFAIEGPGGQGPCYDNDLLVENPGDVGWCATWNGASDETCATTPVRNRTWGQIKAIYR